MDKNAFFAGVEAGGLKRGEVDVPGFGRVHTRGLTGDEYDRFEAESTVKGPDGKQVFKASRALLARLGVVNEHGQHVFGDEDLPRLRNLGPAVLIPIANSILTLSGVGEAIEKN